MKSSESFKDFWNLRNQWNLWKISEIFEILEMFEIFKIFYFSNISEISWDFLRLKSFEIFEIRPKAAGWAKIEKYHFCCLLNSRPTFGSCVAAPVTSSRQSRPIIGSWIIKVNFYLFFTVFIIPASKYWKKKPMIYNPYSDISLMTPTYHRRARATARALLYFVALFIKNILYVFQELVLSSFVFTIHLCCAALSKYKLLWCVGGWVTMFILPNLALKLRIIFHCDCFTANI